MEALRSVVKDRLLDYIANTQEEEFSELIAYYEQYGGPSFMEDVDLAVEAILRVQEYEMENIYRNLRDRVAFEHGVLANEFVLHEGSFRLEDVEPLDNVEKGEVEYAGFVMDWVEHTLKNPYYADLFSSIFICPVFAVNEAGQLAGIDCFFSTRVFTLITDNLELKTLVMDEIHVATDGEPFYLYRHIQRSDDAKPYGDLKEFLLLMMNLGDILPARIA